MTSYNVDDVAAVTSRTTSDVVTAITSLPFVSDVTRQREIASNFSYKSDEEKHISGWQFGIEIWCAHVSGRI